MSLTPLSMSAPPGRQRVESALRHSSPGTQLRWRLCPWQAGSYGVLGLLPKVCTPCMTFLGVAVTINLCSCDHVMLDGRRK